MPCYSPWTQNQGGWQRPLACGQCRGCRLEKSRQDAIRCVHEAKMHEHNCFVTLTLAQDQESLDHRQWVLFAKRLRAKHGPFRFFMSGEYGEQNLRPHYHACIFGLDFQDKKYFGKSPGGAKLYESDELTQIWQLGYTTLGQVTFQSAAYVARYIMKKITGDPASAHYGDRIPEYCRMSNGGRAGTRGIGYTWFEKYGKSDVLPDGQVLVNGVKSSPPRYYRKLLREKYPLSYKPSQLKHAQLQRDAVRDSGPQRLESKEKIMNARLAQLKRKL